MTALGEMFEGSFRGVEFFVSRTTTTGGRKTASHEFTNSDFREVEDLGKQLKKFNIIGTINDTGGSHLQKKIDLIDALDKKGPGKLSHPFYGEFEVVAKPYTIEDDITKLGETTFIMAFEVEVDQVIIRDTFGILGDISKLKSEFSDKLGLDVAQEYFASTLAAINAATEFIDDISETLNDITALYSQAFATVSDLVSSIQNLKNNIVDIVNLPDRIVSDFENIFDRIGDVFTSKKEVTNSTSSVLTDSQKDSLGTIDTTETEKNILDRENAILAAEEPGEFDETENDINNEFVDSLESLFDFNRESPRIIEILSASTVNLNGEDPGTTAAASTDIGNSLTVEQAEIINNEKVLTNLIQGNALALAYEVAAQVEYSSIDEVEAMQQRLEDQFQNFVSDASLSNDVVKTLERLRNTVDKFFFNKKLTVNQVIDKRINSMPAQVLAFNLYGSDDLSKDLIKLNDEVDISRMSGDIKILTA